MIFCLLRQSDFFGISCLSVKLAKKLRKINDYHDFPALGNEMKELSSVHHVTSITQ